MVREEISCGKLLIVQSDRCWQALKGATEREGLDVARVKEQTDDSPLAEGLHVMVDFEGGEVVARYKWVRASFLISMVDSGSQWIDRPILPNQLAPPAAIREEFGLGILRHPLQRGYTPDGEQRDVPGGDPLAAGDQGVAVLVEEHAAEQQQ